MDKRDTFNITRFINAIRFNIFRIIFIIIVFWGYGYFTIQMPQEFMRLKVACKFNNVLTQMFLTKTFYLVARITLTLKSNKIIFFTHKQIITYPKFKIEFNLNSKPLDVPEKNLLILISILICQLRKIHSI